MDAPPLRRADWRFLLQAASGRGIERLVIAGGPRGLGERLVAIGAARVSGDRCAEGAADAVALLDDATVSLAEAARYLSADGVIYWEVNRRGLGGWLRGSGWIRRQLRLAGLQPLQMYWVIPEFTDARRYLPLHGSAPAVQWFFATRFVASSPVRRLLAWTIELMGARRGALASMLVPARGVVAVRKGSPGRGSGDAGPHAAPGNGHVLLTSGQDDGSRVVMLPFLPESPTPGLVRKMARLPDFVGHTAQEQATLTQLRGRLAPALRETLPQPLGTMPDAGSGFAETVVPGRMLAASTGTWRARFERQHADLNDATDWLGQFHLATIARRVRWSQEESARWIEPGLVAYQQAFGVEAAESALFEATRRRARELEGELLPIVWLHNDFNPWHVYREGARLAVIDWEFAGERLEDREGLPLCDLAYFVTHWINLARGLTGEAAECSGLRDLYARAPARDRRTGAARSALAQYMARLDVNDAFLPLLAVCTWVERAVDRGRRQAVLSAPGEDQRQGNRFVRYVEALSSDGEAVFRRVPARPSYAGARGPREQSPTIR